MRETTILVVDDEPQICRVLKSALESSGWKTRVAADGESAWDLYNASRFDLVITDLSMPGMDGIELCSRIRKVSSLPIVVLSVKGEEKTKVRALDAGADDYVTKPFGIDELTARVRALLRRSGPEANGAGSKIEIGDFSVDQGLRKVLVKGREVRLTPKEYDLLLFFLTHSDRVLTHKTVLTAVWGAANAHQGDYLRVFIWQLRKKLEEDPSSPEYIKTEPWVGYRFQPSH
jgi:two-component system, OmpR family, KDP operon response regulator KdpE